MCPHAGIRQLIPPQRYIALLHAAGTTGYSIYPAEGGMNDQDWQAYGQAITSLRLAQEPR